MQCHDCKATIEPARVHSAERFVASDCQPVRGLLQMAACPTCGLVQKADTPAWQELCGRIYSDYRIYHQSAGKEQMARGVRNGTFAPRSDLLTEFLREAGTLPSQGTVLDIGCGNGGFLKAFNKGMAGWKIVGAELNETFRDDIHAIADGARFISSRDIDAITDRFELVTLIHCLEHIPAPTAYLQSIRRLLPPGGTLLVQVPDAELNPFDLMIADHASHYSKVALANVARRAGFEVIACGNVVLGKEISLLARVASQPVEQAQIGKGEKPVDFLDRNLGWIQAIRGQAVELSQRPPFAIFGSSIAGSWIASEIDGKLTCFVDEDDDRIGRSHLGAPIVRPAEVPASATLLIALEPGLAARIRDRISTYGYSIQIPPNVAG